MREATKPVRFTHIRHQKGRMRAAGLTPNFSEVPSQLAKTPSQRNAALGMRLTLIANNL